MFDSGFLELMVVAVIALLVVGPERLPGIARKVGAFVGKARAFINTTKADIEKELQASEMKSMLSRQEKEISELRDMMQDAKKTIEHEVEELDESLDKSLADASSTSTKNTAEKAALTNDNNDNKKS
ncbi:MAG: Sec-independent protein translocase protein TatB [Thiotrichaceae bacterium]